LLTFDGALERVNMVMRGQTEVETIELCMFYTLVTLSGDRQSCKWFKTAGYRSYHLVNRLNDTFVADFKRLLMISLMRIVKEHV
jgi:ppGpp synthetase/RelA/SpoT-type nucleotidyltranferase